MPEGYFFVEVEIADSVAYEAYRTPAPDIISAHGGRILVHDGVGRGDIILSLDGGWVVPNSREAVMRGRIGDPETPALWVQAIATLREAR